MSPFIEFEPDARFVLAANEATITVDRAAATITLQWPRLIGRPRETAVPLDEVAALTLELVDTPPPSFATAGQMMNTVLATVKSGNLDQQRLMDEIPKGLGIKIERAGSQGETIEAFCAAPCIRDGAGLITAARQLADAAGFGYWAVFVTPHAGTEARLSSRPAPMLGRLPKRQPGEAAETSAEISSEALARATVPPFEPLQFRGNHKLSEWQPGIRVVFRRAFSKAAPFVFPFTLCALAGPALWISALLFGVHVDALGLLIAGAIGLAIGGLASITLSTMLPRTVEFVWSSRALSIHTWLQTKLVPFEHIECLVLEAHRHESSGGESGSTEPSYLCKLRARERSTGDKTGKTHEIVDTDFLRRPEQPLRLAVPLLLELAAALAVEGRIEDYDYHK